MLTDGQTDREIFENLKLLSELKIKLSRTKTLLQNWNFIAVAGTRSALLSGILSARIQFYIFPIHQLPADSCFIILSYDEWLATGHN